MTEAGIKVCAPVHDAVLIEADLDEVETTLKLAKDLMIQASAEVLGGFPLACDVNLIQHRDRFVDERGRTMWQTVVDLVELEHPLARRQGYPWQSAEPVQSI